MSEPITIENEKPPAPTLGQATARGATWLAAAGLASQGIQFVGSIVVAWYLSDDDYGLFYTAMIVTSIAGVFVSFGFGPAINSGRMDEPEALITSHWIICLVGTLMALAVFFIGRPAAVLFFHDPKVEPIISVTCLMLAFNAWRVVPDALLRRDGKFNVVAVVSVISQMLATSAGITLAFKFHSVWALVAPALVNAFVGTILSIAYSRLRIRPHFHLPSVRPYFDECWHMMGNSFTNWFFDFSDQIVIRGILGKTILGIYGFSQNLVEKSMEIFARSAASPLMSSLGPLRDNLERIDRAAVRACTTIARITFPLAGGGIVMCTPIMATLLRHKRDNAIPVVQVFFLLGAMQSVGQISGPVWQAMGKSRLVFYWGLTSNLSIVLAFLAGALVPHASALTVAISYTAYSGLVLTPLVVWATHKWCNLPLKGLIPGLLRVVRDVVVMCGVVFAARYTLEQRVHIRQAITLAPLVMLGASTYVLLFRFYSTQEMRAVLSAMPRIIQRWGNRLLAMPPA